MMELGFNTSNSNAINGTNVYVIHAQTPRFFVKDGTCSGEADEPTEGNTCKPVTVTTTVTATSTVTSCPNAGKSRSPSFVIFFLFLSFVLLFIIPSPPYHCP